MYLVDKKYTLAKMYGRMRGYEAPAMSDAQFNRKRELCAQVLAVMDKIIPGRMRKRGGDAARDPDRGLRIGGGEKR